MLNEESPLPCLYEGHLLNIRPLATPFTALILVSLAMASPAKPLNLQPGLSYIHVTSSQPPQAIQDALSHDQIKLKYLGPVGELEGEHVFEVRSPNGQDVLPRGELPTDLVGAVKGIQGVKGAKVLETKQRAKREEF